MGIHRTTSNWAFTSSQTLCHNAWQWKSHISLGKQTLWRPMALTATAGHF